MNEPESHKLIQIMSKKTVGQKYEYELKDKLGSGAFGEVFKGRNKSTNEIVAIKVIKRALLAKYGDDILKQIHQEVAILQQLVEAMKNNICPFINKIYECMETTNNIYIVLEFCNQGTLLDLTKKTKKLPEDHATFIIFQLAQALAFLSENQIAHRDIKPENVFIKDGIYQLGDFGFAGQKSLYQTHLGTYPYMAPEFFNSSSYDGNQVDVWALGLMFHQILTGEIYFIGNSQYEVSQKILNKPYIIDQKHPLSADARDLLPKMVEKDKNKRITAKKIVEHQLFDKFRTDPRYLKIMDDERKWMESFQKQQKEEECSFHNQQISEEERQRQEEEAKQRELTDRLNKEQLAQYHDQVTIISEAINLMRNSITLMVQFCIFLQENMIEICRYDILLILKQALIQQQQLKEKFDRQHSFTEKDHIKFKVVQPQTWNTFYLDNKSKELADGIEADKNIIRKNYIDYLNYINNYTSTSYPDHTQNLQQILNLDFQRPVDSQYFNHQLYSTADALSKDLEKAKDEFAKSLIKKVIYWIYIAMNYQDLINGSRWDCSKIMEQLQSNSLEVLKADLIA